MSCFSIMAVIHGSLRNSLKSQTLWLHCRVSGDQGAGPLTPEPAQGSVFLRRCSWNRRCGDAAALWIIVRRSLRKQKQELEQAKGRGTPFPGHHFHRSAPPAAINKSHHHWWMQTLFMRHKDQKAGWADGVRCSKGHLSSRTTENWCRDSAPHLDPVMWVEVAPHANNLLLISYMLILFAAVVSWRSDERM